MSENEEIRVLVVDDEPLFRRGMITALSSGDRLRVIGEASDGNEAIGKVEELRPNVIVIGVKAHADDNLEAIRCIRGKRLPNTVRIVAVSDENSGLFEAVKAGVDGYLLRDVAPEELVSAVTHVARGEATLSPEATARLLRYFRSLAKKRAEQQAVSDGSLSEREREILQLMAKGDSNKEIGSKLFITEHTVKAHIRSILRKHHLKNRCQAVAWATKEGVISVELLPAQGV
jgi:two-component system NarL family response regulator